MKSILLGFGLLVSSILSVSAQSTDTTIVEKAKIVVSEKVHAVDTSSNFKLIYADLKDGVKALASALKVGTEHVYEVIVRQQVAIAITDLIILLVFGGVLIYGWRLIFKNWDKMTRAGSEPLVIIPGFLSLIYAFVFMSLIDNIVMGFVNPEYGAIKQVVEIVSDLKNK